MIEQNVILRGGPLLSKTWVLNNIFEFSEFRGLQEKIIDQIISGGDSLVLMPTGFGKSLCYQLPAIIREGLTLVISPLLSLMKDQVDSLNAKNIPACTLNSTQSKHESALIIEQIKNNECKILFVSPERAMRSDFIKLVESIQLGLIAVDEAHCISEWGHDFRPKYRELSYLKRRFIKVPFIALTATASRQTCVDIVRNLELNQAKVFVSGFDRPNIFIEHIAKSGTDLELYKKLSKLIHPEGATLIYCLSRKKVKAVALYLKKQGLCCRPYHGGLAMKVREAAQNYFMNDENPVMVATNAFGMGIDRSDVRTVIHLDMPASIEAYYQEIGRAGRDGEESHAMLFYSGKDCAIHKMMARKSTRNKLRQSLEYSRIDKMFSFVESPSCKRYLILKHFREEGHCQCDKCSSCVNQVTSIPVNDFAVKVIEEVRSSGLLPANTYDYYDLLEKLATIKFEKNYCDRATWKAILGELILHEAVSLFDANNRLKIILTPIALKIISGELDISISKKIKFTKSLKNTKTGARSDKNKTRVKPLQKLIPQKEFQESFSPYLELYEVLVKKRTEISRLKRIPAYRIFTDETLKLLSIHKPTSNAEMLEIKGIGPQKVKKYGKIFQELINPVEVQYKLL
jgi:ATP-dependent DNA helicase RecQ